MPTLRSPKLAPRQQRVVRINAALNQGGKAKGRREGASVIELDRAGNLHDAAYDRLRRALMDGHFAPGQTFTIRALAAVFGTSPMPVRDALKRLVAERALELGPSRSVVLPLMSRARFLEILQVRLSLESMLAARATPRVTPALVQAMAADHDAMCAGLAAHDAPTYLAANRSFHFRLYEAADSQVMLPIVESLWMQIGPHLNQIFRTSGKATTLADHHHLTLLRALRRQDAQAAAKAIHDDLADAADTILAGDSFEEAAT